MRFGVQHVYWMLLLTSVVSSALLFLIVASESVQSNKFIGPDRRKHESDLDDNDSRIGEIYTEHERPSSWAKLATKDRHDHESIQTSVSSSFDALGNGEGTELTKGIKIPKESLAQRPNLSRGISEGGGGGGQPVVVTLIDNRQAASLENLATRSTTEQLRHGAVSATAAANVSEQHHHHQPVRLPKSIDEATTTTTTIDDADNNNDNNNDVNSNNETESTKTTTTTTDDVVVVVRAERKSHNVDVVQQAAVGRSDGDDKDDSATTTTQAAAGAALVTEIDDDKKPQQQQQDVEPITREEQQQQPIVVVVPPQTSQEATADGLAEEGSATAATTASVPAVPSPEPTQHEEIPSFNEWAQKRLEEAEKKKTGHPNASIQTANGGASGRGLGGMRMHSKNYASPDCGAKIVAVNPEAQSAKNVLVSTRDEYMLNTCKTRIWFVVQLCEAIQAKKIELANFELFSSSPKDLSVYVSDRFPSRDWSAVGQFQARDERDVQSFQLQPQLFGRFIKVELHTHYGSEHFCPISLFRAYGTSEFEVLETETESDQAHADRASSADGDIAIGDDFEASESDDDDLVFIDEAAAAPSGGSDSQQAARNNHPPPVAAPNSIFGSARDAVLSLVRKAAEVLVKSRDLRSSNNITKIQESIEGDVLGNETLDDCTTPVYNVACKDCDDRRFARVFQLISCKRHYLEALLGAPFLRRALIESHLCSSSAGFEVLLQDGGDDDACGDSAAAAAKGVNRHGKARLLAALFTPDHVIALCNVLAAKEQRLFANVSHQQRQNETMADARQQQGGTAIERDAEPSATAASVLAASRTTIILATDTTSVVRSKTDGPRQASPTLGLVVESATKQIRPTKTVSIEEAKKLSILDPVDSSKSHHQQHHASSEETRAGQSETSSISAANAVPEAASKRLASSSPKVSQSEQSQMPSTQDTVSKRETSIVSDREQQARVDGADKDTKAARTEEASQDSRTKTEQLAKAKADDQDSKDQLNFESFDFEVESNGGGGGGGVKPDSTIASQPANTVTQQQQHQQKESVFLRLSNRIKVLERNMSLSSQYLEELSRRYKKQVEEMQRTLERAMSAMSEESRKGEERETKRLEEVTGLRRQIDVLTHLLEDLYRERESWSLRSCLSHGLFCLINVTIVLAVLSYCKRGAEEEYVDDVNQVTTADGRRDVVLARSTAGSNKARSYELVKQNTSQMAKKPKKRRPSEIAAQVSGNYEQLMIESVVSSSLGNPTTKAGRRKRRKKDSLVTRSASIKETGDDSRMVMHSRSASASDALCYGGLETTNAGLAHQKQSRPDSAPDSSIAYFPVPKQQQQSQAKSAQDKRIQILKMNEANAVAVDKSDDYDDDDEEIERKDDENGSVDGDNFGQPDSTTSSIRCKPMKIMSPSFMRTALSSRSKRLSFSSGKKTFHRLGSSTIIQDSLSELEVCSSTNGHFEESDGSASTTPSKKEKKTSWPKRMKRQPTR
ncbi:uncharacterized protein LOC106655481 [Trichogramma pretiosum]|uniref:uncharacterized protein LOC106655481 n=1 Tax=Trichogramma pretiosum TaxID=7493 RepID=UPI0006C9BC0D|nr:uncharacterized protein LOC106655481 [Trichogramma pretiosum]